MSDSGSFAWPGGAKGAVSLAYFGALPEHVELALPRLREHDLRATFFVSPTRLLDNPVAWQRAARDGHEIASHSLYGVTLDGRLDNWTLEMVADDLLMTQKLIGELFGFRPESFALPGRHPECSEGDYRPVVEKAFDFVVSDYHRGSQTKDADLKLLRTLDLNEGSERQIDSLYLSLGSSPKNSRKDPGWRIFRFEHIAASSLLLARHDRLLGALASPSSATATAPVNAIGRHILSTRSVATA